MSTRLAFITQNDTIAAQNGTATSPFDAMAFQEQQRYFYGREIWEKRKLENGRDFCRVGNETIMFKRFHSRLLFWQNLNGVHVSWILWWRACGVFAF